MKLAVKRMLCVLVALALAAPVWHAAAATPDEEVNRLAARYAADIVAYDPTLTYSTGVPTDDHSRFADRTPESGVAIYAKEEAVLAALNAIDPASLSSVGRPVYATLREQLEADLQMRVCKTEYWYVNHFGGWQSGFADVASEQPVGTPEARAQALTRWRSVPRFVDVEIANLRTGLAQGYSAPKSVVRRVIETMRGLAALPVHQSPLYSPAKRDNDAAFKAEFEKVIAGDVNPALLKYRDFLQNEYLAKARESVSLSALPNGAACYQAYLRYYTTLNRTPQEVFDLGSKTVAANKADVIAIGKRSFGTDDYATIVKTSKGRPENKFTSKDALLAYSRDILIKAKAKTPVLVARMPKQDVVIEPLRDFEETAGVSSHYEPNPDTAKPGVFRIQLGNWHTQTRGQATLTVVHEAWPGHHLQVALARELQPDTAISKLAYNSAYVEGWARYAEAMAEEAGIYDSDDTLIARRVWTARGMVVDPGLHALGWSRQQAADYLISTGRFTANGAEDMIDRMAVMPGQLTAYDSGGLEIKALRAEAQAVLGKRFDLRAFNQAALEQGAVPLSELRAHVMAWVATSKAK
jgi:uncharacterized protein (DUF885 family)